MDQKTYEISCKEKSIEVKARCEEEAYFALLSTCGKKAGECEKTFDGQIDECGCIRVYLVG